MVTINDNMIPVSLLNNTTCKVLVCIMNNPVIDALKIAKKTRIPQATVYRVITSLRTDELLIVTGKPAGRKGGNSTLLFTAKRKMFKIIIDKKGVRIVK